MNPWAILLPYLVAALSGLAAGWLVQGFRLTAAQAEFRMYRAQVEAGAATAEIEKSNLEWRWSQEKEDAEKDAGLRQAKIEMERGHLRAAVDGLRRDNAALRERLAGDAGAACAVPATTLLDLYEECVDEYRTLAGEATRHASDIETLIAAWPAMSPRLSAFGAGAIPQLTPATVIKEN
jgi:hypothetical protein